VNTHRGTPRAPRDLLPGQDRTVVVRAATRRRGAGPLLLVVMAVALVVMVASGWVPAARWTLRIEAVAAAAPRHASRPTPAVALRSSPRTIRGVAGPGSSPLTIPLAARPPNAHVNPIFADLSIAGFAAFLLIAAVQFFLTRPKRRGRRTL
jgi:hypothetical protein